MRCSAFTALALVLVAPALAEAKGSQPTPWANVQEMVRQSNLIAVVKVRAADKDDHRMAVDVKKVLFSEKRAPRRLVLTYFAGDEMTDRVPVGSLALAFLVDGGKRWTPAYADGFGVFSIQEGEVIEWFEGKKQGYFYTLEEVTHRIEKWARKRSER